MEEAGSLASFYAQKVPELCGLCGASGDVRWTAMVFYRRFFAVCSPMEHDPLPAMFACVHLACKVEEEHHITLEKLLAAADLGSDRAMQVKVADSEICVLEGMRFQLMVEPKPHAALRLLLAELRAKRDVGEEASGGLLPEEALGEPVAERAEELACALAARTDATLRWPASAIIAAALRTALDERLGRGAEAGSRAEEARRCAGGVLMAVLAGPLESEAQRRAMEQMVEAARGELAQLAVAVLPSEASLKDVRRAARRCHRAFERLRADAAATRLAAAGERKKRAREASREAAAPGRNLFEELRKATAEIRAERAQVAGASS